jgi:hypothetical protein
MTNTLVSFVLNRSRRDFSDRDCAALELVRAPLARMYRQARAMAQAQDRPGHRRGAWLQ